MWRLSLVTAVVVATLAAGAEDELRDFDFSPAEEERETMVAQESRAVGELAPAPGGVTNSHRPQYSVDSYERREEEGAGRGRTSELRLREAVVRALERKEHARKFAQVLPIVRAMSSSQRGALAALVAGQLAAPALAHRRALTLHQVRSMYGTESNATSDLMLPILLDMANLFRRAARPTKQPRAATLPRPLMLRRSIEDHLLYDEDESVGVEQPPPEEATSAATTTTTTAAGRTARARGGRRAGQNRTRERAHEPVTRATHLHTSTDSHHHTRQHTTPPPSPVSATAVTVAARAAAILSVVHAHSEPAQNRTSVASTPAPAPASAAADAPAAPAAANNATLDQTADSSNSSLAAEELPVAERLRARFNERKVLGGKPGRRPTWSPLVPGKPPLAPSRRGESAATQAAPAPAPGGGPAARRRPAPPPARKLAAGTAPARSADPANCELFTNSLCLEAEDYPTEAILMSLRRNKAAAGALLADYKEQAEGAGAVDGVTAQQEATYTAEHYLHANRRGDSTGSVRDFAGAGEAGFMCPSTVKYARPQRARATSGNWKYIVNTGEHTQTLRLEKCLKPKESCTYLTDNFKSKCVQVYNYHRLLTWDQQNGLHMDIFKVPTCCSCHIEGYSVAFPPVGHRAHETSSERFPGQDLSHETGAFDSALGQSSVARPTLTKTANFLDRPSDNFGSFGDSTNSIPGAGFGGAKFSEEELDGGFGGTGPTDSYGNSYFPDSFKQASVPVRNVKKPPRLSRPSAPPPPPPLSPAAPGVFDTTATLPSYLEPPTQSAVPSAFFGATPEKFKYSSTQHKRTKRPSRRPIRKTASGSGVGDDLLSSGSSHVEAQEQLDFDDFVADFDEFAPHRPTNRIASPPVAATTEAVRPSSTIVQRPTSTIVQRPTSTAVQRPSSSQADRGTAILKDISLNKRVNYNYHPIIDFFESGSPGGGGGVGASDRDDSVSSLGGAGASDSDWKPMSHPLVRAS